MRWLGAEGKFERNWESFDCFSWKEGFDVLVALGRLNSGFEKLEKVLRLQLDTFIEGLETFGSFTESLETIESITKRLETSGSFTKSSESSTNS
jgi:hypothetical protein